MPFECSVSNTFFYCFRNVEFRSHKTTFAGGLTKLLVSGSLQRKNSFFITVSICCLKKNEMLELTGKHFEREIVYVSFLIVLNFLQKTAEACIGSTIYVSVGSGTDGIYYGDGD